VLLLLTAVYVLNFLDRSLIYILFTPIKAEMQLSDLQLALLGTTSFVIFYTLLEFPGLALAAAVFFLREPPRGRTEVAAVRFRPEDWKILFRSVPLRYLYAGYALFGLASNYLGIWGTVFFVRVHSLSLAQIGIAAGCWRWSWACRSPSSAASSPTASGGSAREAGWHSPPGPPSPRFHSGSGCCSSIA
jgi:hypothetical protein